MVRKAVGDTSAAGPARRVDGNAVSSDRIENGHGQYSPLKHTVNAVDFGLDQFRL
jgi:hypothetical protein